jgi:hypothetical protein
MKSKYREQKKIDGEIDTIKEELRKEIEKEAKRRTQGFKNQENCIQSYIMGASDFIKEVQDG